MVNSYLEFYEPARGDNPLSHPFVGPNDISTINTSFDWAGGGIVSTAGELATFFRALLEGRLFQQEETLDMMLKAADRGFGMTDFDYGYGTSVGVGGSNRDARIKDYGFGFKLTWPGVATTLQ